MKVGFIGLGSMGLPMAANLIKNGHEVTVWNRTQSKANSLLELGASWADSPSEVCSPDGIVVTMVSKDDVLLELTQGEAGLGQHLREGGIHVSMSTVSADTTRTLQALHQQHGAHYVAAPVFGRPDAAEAQKLFILCAGPKAACEKVQPILDAMGQKTFDLGEDPTHANVIKLGGNFMIMGLIESLGEALTLCEKSGIERQKFVDVLSQSIMPAPIVANYGAQIAANAYEPAKFKLELGLKDANLVLHSAGQANLAMPLAQLMQSRFQTAVANNRGHWDWTGAAFNVSEDAGLQK